MAEYIDREKALRAVQGQRGPCRSPAQNQMLDYLRAAIMRVPAADVVEVVRCKDCKHYRNHPNGMCYLHTEPKENARGHSGDAVCVEPEDFCSYGERKGGDTNGS